MSQSRDAILSVIDAMLLLRQQDVRRRALASTPHNQATCTIGC